MNYKKIPFIYKAPIFETILTGGSIVGFTIGVFIVTYLVFVIQSFIAALVIQNEYIGLGAFLSFLTSVQVAVCFAFAGPMITIPVAVYNIVSFIKPDAAMHVGTPNRVLLSFANVVFIMVGCFFAKLFFTDIDTTLDWASGLWYLKLY